MRRGLLLISVALLASTALQAQQTRLEDLQGKTILIFTPHPDDEVFGAGGTIALLNRHHNKVILAIYTNDDKGSLDPEMSSQRLARIRKAEEEKSEAVLGTPKENIMWLGYDDGMLEYAPQPHLTEQATEIIRRVRPDVLLSVDPGQWYTRWHKTDHRMAGLQYRGCRAGCGVLALLPQSETTIGPAALSCARRCTFFIRRRKR